MISKIIGPNHKVLFYTENEVTTSKNISGKDCKVPIEIPKNYNTIVKSYDLNDENFDLSVDETWNYLYKNQMYDNIRTLNNKNYGDKKFIQLMSSFILPKESVLAIVIETINQV